MRKVKFTIVGKIPSMKNTLRFAHGHVFHADNAVARYKRTFVFLTPADCKNKIKGECCVHLKIVRESRRQDPTNAIDTVMDALEFAGVIEDDRLAVLGTWEATELSKNNPRVEIEVEEVKK